MKKYLYFLLAVAIVSCKKQQAKTDNPVNSQTWPPDSVVLIQATKTVSEVLNGIINKNQFIDSAELIRAVMQVNGVKNADLVSERSLLNISYNDGTSSNILLITKDNPTLFNLSNNTYRLNNSLIQSNRHNQTLGDNSTSVSDIPLPYPVADGGPIPTSRKALILAPFQHFFKQDLGTLKKIMEYAGYQVTVDTNAVTYNEFKGDYLAEFGIIYISTHGNSNYQFSDKTINTTLATGQEYNFINDQLNTISLLNKADLVPEISINGYEKRYFAVTTSFIRSTLTKKFPNSLVYVDACQSARKSDLSDLFLQNGATCYIGYSSNIFSPDVDPIQLELMALLTSGYGIKSAINMLQNYQGLKPINLTSINKENVSGMIALTARYNDNQNFRIVNDINAYVRLNNRYGTLNINDKLPIDIKAKAVTYNSLLSQSQINYEFVTSQNIKQISLQREHAYIPYMGTINNDWFDGATIADTLTVKQSQITKTEFPKALIFFVEGTKNNAGTTFKTVAPYTINP